MYQQGWTNQQPANHMHGEPMIINPIFFWLNRWNIHKIQSHIWGKQNVRIFCENQWNIPYPHIWVWVKIRYPKIMDG